MIGAAMFIFSVTATAKNNIDDIEVGKSYPFIVYIHYQDLFGAEHLCKLYLLKEGFGDAVIEKRKFVDTRVLENKEMVNKDPQLLEAKESGYALQLFEAH